MVKLFINSTYLNPDKMKTILYIIIGIFLFSCTSKKENFGKLLIIENQYFYENDDIFSPHDYFVEVDMQRWNGWLDTALFLRKANNHLIIANQFNDGLSGHKIKFTISKNLDITNIEFESWTDVINGGKSKYTAEKVIFSVNTNPFECSLITGFYTLQIREDIFYTDKAKYGANDTSIFYIFNGKFKVYSEKEKKNGRDWIISQNEILLGIKDSLDVYNSPDKFAEFTLGNDALIQILKQFEIERSKTIQEKKKFVSLEMVIDENGKVIPESMTIIEEMKSDELICTLKNCELLLFDWKPAIFKGKPVKSKVILQINIKDLQIPHSA
jgi:hypothetical protein